MSDPTIQTFCCHHGNGTDVAVTIIQELDTDAYNFVCLFSSALGVLGAVYQILPRREFTNNHRWLSFSAERGRKIIIWLAVADLFAAIGVFSRSMLWISYKNIMPAIDDDSSVLFCSISSAFIQYFYTSTCIWTLCYAMDMRFTLSQGDCRLKYYHCAAWVIPAVLTITGLMLLYFPDADCHSPTSLQTIIYRILPNYIATYIPIVMVMIANPILYHQSMLDMKRIITSTSGQFTNRERHILEAISIKFCVINGVFYICWIPNLINGILLWALWFDLPSNYIIAVWYTMAFTNPLQAFFNCMVYRRWNLGSERLILPWRRYEVNEYVHISTPKSSENSRREEKYPLLPGMQTKSINGYQSLP